MKNKIKSLLGVIIVAISVIALTVCVYAEGDFGGGSGGGIGTGDGGGGLGSCSWENSELYGGCYSKSKSGGFFWVKIGIDSNHVPFQTLKANGYFSYLRKEVRNKEVFNCLDGGGAAYFLVVRMYRINGEWGGLGAGIPLNEAWGYIRDGDPTGTALPSGVTAVSAADAEAQFKLHEQAYAVYFNQYYNSSSNMTWFCADLKPTTTKSTTKTPTPRRLACGAILAGDRSMGDTRTRIAVQNMTMDGADAPTDGNGNVRLWQAKSYRRSGSQDSNWTPESAHVQTLAKPGDTVRFYHAICMAVRYGRRTPTQNSWTGQQGYSTDYTALPTQSAFIGASPSNYLFDNKGVLGNVNSQIASVSRHNPNLFHQIGGSNYGSLVDATYSAIDLLQPTDTNQDYNCNAAPAMYAAHGVPYVPGGYQVPGFDSGNCTSASKTGIRNPVGTQFSQYHTFDSLKMWEQYSHSIANSCGCGSHGAYLVGNYFAGSFESYRSGIHGYRKEYYCRDEGKTTLDCAHVCDTWHPIYHYCTHTHPTKVEYHYSDHSFTFMYSTTHRNYGRKQKTATVYVPYNFNTETGSSLDVGEVIFQGTAVTAVHNWKITPRGNSILSSFTYATVTPSSTKRNLIEFLLPPGSRSFYGDSMTSDTPCGHYNRYGAVNCHAYNTDTIGNQNPQGYYEGSQRYEVAYTRTVPDNDEYVGWKYCVATGIWPADSHDGGGNSIGQQSSYGYGGAMDAGQLWNVSDASCRTIAKKPKFQVWNGSLYTEGDVHTSIQRKVTGISMGAYNGNGTTVFGSWADYGLYVGKENKVMASGAMLGYSGYTLAAPSGRPIAEASQQQLNPQTASNTTTPTGNSGIYANAAYGTNLMRLTARYKDKARTFAQSEKIDGVNKTGSSQTIYTAKTGMHYVYYNGSTSTSSLKVSHLGYNKNYDKVSKSGNNIIVGLGDGINDNTLVIVVTGTLTINGNICLGSSGSCNSDATQLINYSYGTSTDAPAKLPQVLIFANNINIAENVTRVDAWLLAPDGTINTCAGHNTDNLVAFDAKHKYTNFGGNCDKTLVVNGPVYAHHMELLRTGGSNHGTGLSLTPGIISDPRYRSLGSTRNQSGTDALRGSSAPAEIFNLRADTYIWAYNQAQRYSEAVVTYTRELAPRY